MRVLDLFSGIGGFSLGLERAGMQTVAFCEIDPYCRAILRRHWPNVPIFDDVRELCRRAGDNIDRGEWVECSIHEGEDFGNCKCVGTDELSDSIGPVNVVCGGFPCQDISLIGKRQGLGGADSGLWFEQLRIIVELSPEWVIIENVAALVDCGLVEILQGLDASGFNAGWFIIPASAIGAPHKRERLWIVANSSSERLEGYARDVEKEWQSLALRSTSSVDLFSGKNAAAWWKSEPGICRVVDGVPDFVDRIACLGNAVIPQIPEIIGRAILAAEQTK